MLSSETVKSKLAEVVPKNFSGSDVILFGSYVRGDAHKDSDWDILVLLNQPTISFQVEKVVSNSYFELELETGEIIMPVLYTIKEWKIFNHSFI